MYYRSPYSKRKNIESNYKVYPAQLSTQSFGRLRIRATTSSLIPVADATVRISSPSVPDSFLEELKTNGDGLTDEIELPAPSFDYSQAPGIVQPYAEYTINISSVGFEPVVVQDAEIFPGVTALQESTLRAVGPSAQPSLYVVPPHTLFGDYPPKIAEAEVKATAESGEIVLSRVVVPEFVIVHDGPPTDSSASNYYVRFRDYIKNVASSEIYSTWPESTITANVLAILSFTMNRVYTEWYRNQGFNFTITSSTAFDHKFVPGRNIFSNIGLIVDQIFNNYLSRPNIRQPILTQYCDGNRVQCPNWLSQWGSKTLGDQGYSAIDILRNYYGDSIYINTATEVSGVPVSWPGANLSVGSSGDNVRTIQEQLNKIAENYPSIPTVAVNGQFNDQTANSVKIFQQTFDLPATGIVDLPTWYKLSGIYVAVARLAE
jgi:peptidoglycan hydrolase-like protein with peptidoglycan-binding domain